MPSAYTDQASMRHGMTAFGGILQRVSEVRVWGCRDPSESTDGAGLLGRNDRNRRIRGRRPPRRRRNPGCRHWHAPKINAKMDTLDIAITLFMFAPPGWVTGHPAPARRGVLPGHMTYGGISGLSIWFANGHSPRRSTLR